VPSSIAVATLAAEAVCTTSWEVSRERRRSQTAAANATPRRTKNVERNEPFFS
jgi:hypothetical protein